MNGEDLQKLRQSTMLVRAVKEHVDAADKEKPSAELKDQSERLGYIDDGLTSLCY